MAYNEDPYERKDIMTEQVSNAVPDVPVVEKKSRFNPRVIGGVVTGVVATALAFVIHGKMTDDDSSEEASPFEIVPSDETPNI